MKTTTYLCCPIRGFLLIVLFFTFTHFTLKAQFASPTIDAAAGSPAEYGSYVGAQHTNESGGFFVTWDADYLYVYLPGINETHASIIYLDTYVGSAEMLRPINSGTNADGNLIGYSYDNLGAVRLPMRADVVIYAKNNYREIRLADGAGNWALLSAGVNGLSGTDSDDTSNGDLKIENNGNGAGNDDRREFRVAWGHIGGFPNAFTWVAHVINPTNTAVYKPSPANGNPVGNFHSTAISFSRYLQVASTANNASTPFYSRECYTHLANAAVSGFGAYTEVFDFTVNNGYRLTRNACTGGDWRIVGSLIVGSGSIVDFGDHTFSACPANYGATKIEGSIDIYDNSAVLMNKTNEPADVDYNVRIFELDGVFSLSTVYGGDVYIGHDFLNNGTFTGNGRAVILDGNSEQIVSGDEEIIVDYFIINNTGDGIRLEREVEVLSELELIDGVVYTEASSKLVMATTASMDAINLGSDASHVNGPMDKQFNSTNEFVYPVGKGAKHRPVAIKPTTATATTFTANYMNIPPNDEGYNTSVFASHPTQPLQNVLNIEYWLIDRIGTADAQVRLFWHDGSSVSELSNLRVAHWNGSAWDNEGNENITGDANSGNITSEIMSSFSPVSFGEITTPAPIELLSFQAVALGQEVELRWTTATEINNDYFVLERSVDGKSFKAIGEVKGQGNSDQSHAYSLIDQEPSGGFNYYRIKDVAFDGAYSYSRVININLGKESDLQVAVVGTSQNKTIQIVGGGQEVAVAVYDRQGRLVFQQEKKLLQGSASIALPQSVVGFHILKVVVDGQKVRVLKSML